MAIAINACENGMEIPYRWNRTENLDISLYSYNHLGLIRAQNYLKEGTIDIMTTDYSLAKFKTRLHSSLTIYRN